MRSLPLKLSAGSDLRKSLQEMAQEQNRSGFVLGVVGNLSRAKFQCPGQSGPTVLEGNLEIITLNGTFSPNSVHLHLSLSDSACQVWGGHLEPGTIVLKGADVLVGFLDLPLPQSALDSAQTPRVEIAVLPGCPWSKKALMMLRSLAIPYIVKTIDNDDSFKAINQRSELKTFPQVFIDGDLIGGYDALSDLHSSGQLEVLR
ncbi:MAG TPA: PCC domain-containing protein [Prochlorococcus sp.]|jgi:predicted DNA-binding protein with PD1-like motif|tara:strand:+ start:72 stop:677 length:606 start_codon:yes stop_codon:yes gene_type:complete